MILRRMVFFSNTSLQTLANLETARIQTDTSRTLETMGRFLRITSVWIMFWKIIIEVYQSGLFQFSNSIKSTKTLYLSIVWPKICSTQTINIYLHKNVTAFKLLFNKLCSHKRSNKMYVLILQYITAYYISQKNKLKK